MVQGGWGAWASWMGGWFVVVVAEGVSHNGNAAVRATIAGSSSTVVVLVAHANTNERTLPRT